MALAAILLVLAVLAWLLGATLIARTVEARLRAAGFAGVSVEDVALGWGTVTVGRLDLGAAGSAADIAVDMSLSDLTAGTPPAVRVGEASGRATLSEDGTLAIPGFTPSETARRGALPMSAIDLNRARLTLSAPQGDFTINGQDIRAVPANGSLEVTGAVALTSPYGRLRGRLAGTADPQTADLSFTLMVEEGTVSAGMIEADAISGGISVEKTGDASPTAEADLIIARPALAQSPLAPLTLTGQWRDRRLTAHIAGTDDSRGATEIRLTGDFSGDAPQIAGSGTVALDRDELAGTVEFEARGAVDTAASPMGFEGQVEARAAGLRHPAWVSDAAMTLAADLAGTTETLRFTIREPLTGRFSPVAALLPNALSSYAGQPLDVSATIGDAAQLDLAAGVLSAAVTLDIRETEGATTARLSGPLTLRMGDEGALLEMPEMTASAAQLRWQETVATAITYQGTARIADAEDWSLTGTSEIAASGVTGPVRYDGLDLTWSGRIAADGPAIRLTPHDCVDMRFRRLTLGSVTLLDVSPPCLGTPEDGPILVSEGEALRFDIAVPAEAPLDMAVEAAPPRHLLGRWPGGRLSGVSGAAGMEQLTADLTGGTLRLETDGAVLTEIGARADLARDTSLTADLRVGAIRSLHAPALWTPLNLEVSVEGTAQEYGVSAILSDTLGILVVEADGTGTMESGRATLTLYPVTFLSGATEPGDLSPLLAETVSDMSGTISFDGEAAWGTSLSSGGRLTVDGLGATVSSMRMEGLDADIALSSLWPTATEGEETVRIARLDVGVPMTDGIVRLEKAAESPPRIGPVAFEMAGGTVTADPFILDLGGAGDTRFTLIAEGVDLERMIEEAEIEGLSGTGTLAGRLPVVVSRDGLQVEDAGLRAVTTGHLQYQPEVLPPFLRGDDTRATMLRQVLRNFQYSQLSLSLGGGSGEDASQRITLSAKGNNPDFLEGHPVELNFDFEGAILNALRSAVSITGADSLERLLEEQERQNGQ